MNETVRAASKSDLSGILDVYRQAGMSPAGTLPVQAAEAIFARMETYPEYRVYVAERDGRIVATFALLIMDNLANMGKPSAIVEDVAVRPDCQRQGLGKAMMDFAMDTCRQKGCYKLVLSSNRRRVDAHRFYELLGFKQHGFSFLVDPS